MAFSVSDLDNLLSTLQPSPSAQPQRPPAHAPATTTTSADLQSLLQSLETSSAPAFLTQQPPAAPSPLSPLPSAEAPLQATITPRNTGRLKQAAVELSDGIDGMIKALTPRAELVQGPAASQASSQLSPSPLQGVADPAASHLTRTPGQAPSSAFTSTAPGSQSQYSDLFRKCKTCQGPIRGESVIVFDYYYHPHHFVCLNCNCALDVSNFYSIGEDPHCAACYAALNSSLCARCMQPCAPGTALFALNKHWHPEHFTCHQCQQRLTGRFFNKEGQPHCEACATRPSGTCAACNLPIISGAVSALGKTWHPEHIVCNDCRIPLSGAGMVFERGGLAYCRTHFENTHALPKCTSCAQPIAPGQPNVVLGAKQWHKEHFKCNFCWAPLDGDYQVSVTQDPYCSGCYVKLF